jgi:hypothetical protein
LPIQISHDVVRRKNENLQYQHIDQTLTKTTPVDADSVAMWDSASLKFLIISFANFKAWIKSWISKEDVDGLKIVNSPEFADTNITSLAANPLIGNTAKSVLSAITNLFTKVLNSYYNTGVAGESIPSAGKPLIRKSDGLLYLANATTPATLGVIGFSTAAVSIGASVTFQHFGYMTLTAHGFTVGSMNRIYVTTSSGGLSNSKPSVNGNGIESVASASDANTIKIQIGQPVITLYVP